MPGKFHNLITKALMELGEELTRKHKTKTRFEKVYDGNKNPIRIINPRKRQLMGWNYYPDIYYITKIERKFIFEVIDGENQNNIISDYIQAMMSPGTHVVIFIVPKEKKEETWTVMETLRGILKEELGVKKLPYQSLWDFDRSEIKNLEITKKLLSEQLQYWYSERPIKNTH